MALGNAEIVHQKADEILSVIPTTMQRRDILRCILVNPDDKSKYARLVVVLRLPLITIAFVEERLIRVARPDLSVIVSTHYKAPTTLRTKSPSNTRYQALSSPSHPSHLDYIIIFI